MDFKKIFGIQISVQQCVTILNSKSVVNKRKQTTRQLDYALIVI